MDNFERHVDDLDKLDVEDKKIQKAMRAVFPKCILEVPPRNIE